MTTGTISFGTPAGPLYYYKSWTGADGAQSVEYTDCHAVRVPIYEEQEYSGRRQSPKVIGFNLETRCRRKSTYSKDAWHSYNCSISRGSNGGGKAGRYISISASHLTSWLPSDTFAAQSKIVQAVKEHSFNASVAIAEGTKTMAMVAGNVKRFYNAIKYLRRGNVPDAARIIFGSSSRSNIPPQFSGRYYDQHRLTTDDVSGLWLEMQYGWKPLISDCYEGAKAWSLINDRPRTSVVKFRHERRVTQDVTWPRPNYVESRVNRHKETVVSTDYVLELLETLSTERSLGLEDPMTVAWELVPFSFVADWFIPIGTYLETLNSLPKLQGILRGTRMYKTTNAEHGVPVDVVYDLNGKPNVPFNWLVGASMSCEDIQILRIPTISDWNVPVKPSFKPLSKSLSPGHILNAIALLNQVITLDRFK